jgi:hypothetical protein
MTLPDDDSRRHGGHLQVKAGDGLWLEKSGLSLDELREIASALSTRE